MNEEVWKWNVNLAWELFTSGIYFYRKIGVILFPVAILFHFYLHEFYLSTMLYSDLFTLFSYVALGLLAIIPKWNFFK